MKLAILLLSCSTMGLVACSSSDTPATTSTDAGVTLEHIDRSGLTDVGVDKAPLDYSDPNLWVCRPGIDKNECYGDLDATAFYADGTSKVIKHERATDPKFDCFYVYPTVDLTGMGNTTNLSDISHVLDALLNQGARFSRICEVYAPLYRQLAISAATAAASDAGTGGDGGASISLTGGRDIAYGDVAAAFDYYMEHWNHERKFVLIGHSQGTFMLQQLMAEKFDVASGDALRKQLVSALLVGGGPVVPANQAVGGTFENIPACTAAAQVGCIVGYNSFAIEKPPEPTTTAFGKASAGNEVICTEPTMLSRNTGLSKGSYNPKDLNTAAFVPNTPAGTLPEFDTPFALFPEVFKGECVRKNGLHYLEVSVGTDSTDKRSIAPYRNTLTESIGFGLHVTDFNLFLDDLIEGVKLQADAALK
jgi:pimeloyl-ACP methyl ester carboxylesterase